MAYLDAVDTRPDEAAIMLELADPIRDLCELTVNRGVGIALGGEA